jgi:VWFA-related protein
MHARDAARLAGAALAIAFAAPLAGQSPVAQPPVFGTDVRVVAVPVFVTDKAGRAVAGLTADDFELEDQGKRVKITAFLAVDATGATPSAEPGALFQASARRQFLLLFDLNFSTPTGIMRAREAAIALVRQNLAPSDLAAVATYGQRGVQILVGFTPDRLQVERAITTLGLVETQAPMRDTLSIAYDMGLPRWGQGIGPPPSGAMNQELIDQARRMARADQTYYKQRVDGFLDSMEQLVKTLDSVQGRKQLVLLSGGFDSSVTSGAKGQESQEASEAVVAGRTWEVQTDRYFGDSAARDSLDKLFKAVALTDTVIHTVDVTGMGAAGGVADALPQPTGRGRDTLAQLAVNTGGRFVADANDLQAGLVSLLEATSHYYLLAFEPLDAKGKPGSPRKLKVRVRGDGLSVSHRRGYALADPKAPTSAASAVLQAAEAITKGLTGGELKLRAVAVPYRSANGRLALPVILQVDGSSLLAGSSAKQLGLEVFGYAFDGAGHVQDAVTLTPVVDLGAVRGSFEAKGLQVITSFAVPKGPVDLRFLVRDKASRRTGSLRLRLEMPGFDGETVVLSPPLAMDDPRARLVVPAPSRLQPQLEIPFRVGERPFTADPLPTLANGATRELCVLAWAAAAGDSSAGEIEAELVDASGHERPLPLAGKPREVADADGTTRYVVTLAPRDVPKGRYRLRLDYTDSDMRNVRSELDVLFE